MFPLFAKAAAHRVFEQLRVILAVDNKDELVSLLQQARDKGEIPGRRPFSYTSIETLINLEHLDTSK